MDLPSDYILFLNYSQLFESDVFLTYLHYTTFMYGV